MERKSGANKKNFKRVCFVLIIAEILSCVAVPIIGFSKKSETVYANTQVNQASYYHTDDVSNIDEDYNELIGKNVAIIGDSISTFEGYIPQGYKHFYSRGDVDSVSKTWWGQLVDETGVDVVANCSWSGSTVTGDSTSYTNAFSACSNKRVKDLANLDEDIDIIICYIGINDYRRNVEIGHWTSKEEVPAESTNVSTFSEGYAIMVNKLKNTYPDAKIYVTTLMNCDDMNNKATYDIDGYNNAIREVADKFDTEIIDLNSFMIDYNDYSTYTLDRLHPNASGHEQMAKRFSKALQK